MHKSVFSHHKAKIITKDGLLMKKPVELEGKKGTIWIGFELC